MYVCTSKKVATKSLDQLGKQFDSRLKEWQAKLISRTVDSAHIQVHSSYTTPFNYSSMCIIVHTIEC